MMQMFPPGTKEAPIGANEKKELENMKLTKKTGTILLAMILTLTLCCFAMAEETTAAPTTEETAAVADTAAEDALKQAEENSAALNEALTAYSNAKLEARKKDYLNRLKEELDSFVEAGTLTQEQADLLLNYYAEQVARNQNGIRHGRKNVQNGLKNGKKNDTSTSGFGAGTPGNGFGRGGKHGRNNGTVTAPQTTETTSADSDATGV